MGEKENILDKDAVKLIEDNGLEYLISSRQLQALPFNKQGYIAVAIWNLHSHMFFDINIDIDQGLYTEQILHSKHPIQASTALLVLQSGNQIKNLSDKELQMICQHDDPTNIAILYNLLQTIKPMLTEKTRLGNQQVSLIDADVFEKIQHFLLEKSKSISPELIVNIITLMSVKPLLLTQENLTLILNNPLPMSSAQAILILDELKLNTQTDIHNVLSSENPFEAAMDLQRSYDKQHPSKNIQNKGYIDYLMMARRILYDLNKYLDDRKFCKRREDRKRILWHAKGLLTPTKARTINPFALKANLIKIFSLFERKKHNKDIGTGLIIEILSNPSFQSSVNPLGILQALQQVMTDSIKDRNKKYKFHQFPRFDELIEALKNSNKPKTLCSIYTALMLNPLEDVSLDAALNSKVNQLNRDLASRFKDGVILLGTTNLLTLRNIETISSHHDPVTMSFILVLVNQYIQSTIDSTEKAQLATLMQNDEGLWNDCPTDIESTNEIEIYVQKKLNAILAQMKSGSDSYTKMPRSSSEAPKNTSTSPESQTHRVDSKTNLNK